MLWFPVKGDSVEIVQFGMGAAESAAFSAMAIQAMVFRENVNFIASDGKLRYVIFLLEWHRKGALLCSHFEVTSE